MADSAGREVHLLGSRAIRLAGISSASIGGAGSPTLLQRIIIEKFAASGVVNVKAVNTSGAVLHSFDASAATAIGSHEIQVKYLTVLFLEVAGGAAEVTFVVA